MAALLDLTQGYDAQNIGGHPQDSGQGPPGKESLVLCRLSSCGGCSCRGRWPAAPSHTQRGLHQGMASALQPSDLVEPAASPTPVASDSDVVTSPADGVTGEPPLSNEGGPLAAESGKPKGPAERKSGEKTKSDKCSCYPQPVRHCDCGCHPGGAHADAPLTEWTLASFVAASRAA